MDMNAPSREPARDDGEGALLGRVERATNKRRWRVPSTTLATAYSYALHGRGR